MFISCSQASINFIHFVYIENGRPLLSDKIGWAHGSISMDTITFDYPSEHFTGISGKYHGTGVHADGFEGKMLVSITFHTNKATYGPYGLAAPVNNGQEVIEFNYHIGGKFNGFFGTYKAAGIESIGFYMKPMPIQRIGLSRMENEIMFEIRR